MRKLKSIIALFTAALVLANCTSESDNNNNEILALALLNQQGTVAFTEVTPGFALRTGEKAFYNPGPWGEAETKENISNFERKTAMDVTVFFPIGTSGHVYFTANANRDLTNKGAIAFLRLEPGLIKGIIQTSIASNATLPEGTSENGAQSGQNPNTFAVTPGQTGRFCLEPHREIELEASKVEVKAHLIAWNKPCEQLSTQDRNNYTWDKKEEIFDFDRPLNATDAATAAEIALGTGVGYVTSDAVVTVRPFNKKFATAGTLR